MEAQLWASWRSPRCCVGQWCPLLEVSHWSQEEALGFYFTGETLLLQQLPSFSKPSLQYIIWGYFISILRDLQCIFSAYITSEKAFGPNYIIKDKTEGLLALLPLFWKNSSRLIESTWFTAKLNGGNHLTDILDDSRGKRHLLLVLLSSDCHHPFASHGKNCQPLAWLWGVREEATLLNLLCPVFCSLILAYERDIL